MTNNADKHIPNQEDDSSSKGMNGSSLDLSAIAKQAVERHDAQRLDKDDSTQKTGTQALSPAGDTTNDLRHVMHLAKQLKAQRAREEEQVKDRVSTFTEGMRFKLTSKETPASIIKDVQGELVVGRADNVTDYQPDIDLTPHGAYRLGLSRRHAIILRQGNAIFVKDLKSRNGTFVNGTAVIPSGNPTLLHNGDDIRFGNLTMHLTFED
ncbi:MAG: hypothetical protein Phog2KO_50680 [Phototrophicaceae bacterium]